LGDYLLPRALSKEILEDLVAFNFGPICLLSCAGFDPPDRRPSEDPRTPNQIAGSIKVLRGETPAISRFSFSVLPAGLKDHL